MTDYKSRYNNLLHILKDFALYLKMNVLDHSPKNRQSDKVLMTFIERIDNEIKKGG